MTDPMQSYLDDGWVQHPQGGWYRPDSPTHCRLQHRLVPGKHTKHWDHDHQSIRCELDGHPDEDSRWIDRDPRPTRPAP